MLPIKSIHRLKTGRRPLLQVYPVLFIDAILHSVRDNGIIRKLAAYLVLGINQDGKEVLTIEVGENESYVCLF